MKLWYKDKDRLAYDWKATQDVFSGLVVTLKHISHRFVVLGCHRYAGFPLVRCRLPRLMTLLPYLMLVSERLRYVKRGNQHQMGNQHATRPFVMKIGQRGLVMTRSRRERGNSHQMGRLEEATAASTTSSITTNTTYYSHYYSYYHIPVPLPLLPH